MRGREDEVRVRGHNAFNDVKDQLQRKAGHTRRLLLLVLLLLLLLPLGRGGLGRGGSRGGELHEWRLDNHILVRLNEKEQGRNCVL